MNMGKQTKQKYRYYVVNRKGRKGFDGVKRKALEKLEQELGKDDIIIGIPESIAQHHQEVLQPFSKVYSTEFGKHELIKTFDFELLGGHERLRQRYKQEEATVHITSRIM